MGDSKSTVLSSFELDESLVSKTLGEVLGHDVDDADIYFERVESDGLSLEEGMVKEASRSVHQGAGIRAVSGDRTGYAHSDSIEARPLLEGARAARAIARSGSASQSIAIRSRAPKMDLYPIGRAGVEEPIETKLDLLQRIDARARAVDPRIRQVFASVNCSKKTVVIARRDGEVLVDERPLIRLSVSCIAIDGSNKQAGSAGGGGRIPLTTYLEGDSWEELVDEAARRAVLNLSAIETPAGETDVVLGPGWPGILLHEAIGHGLEGDFNRKKTSAFSDLLGQKVASELVTVVDDGTIPWRRGSLNVDDEGTPTQNTVLIEKGVLKGYMQDRLNARLMGMAATGNGRRQSYAHTPMPRMTNTFMLAGKDDPAEIIAGVKKGIYAVAFGGGQVDITSGKFVFAGSEAYLIEDGKITSPVKGATFIGNGPDVLTRVSAVGHDLELDKGTGTCGKDGQSVPVGVGMPTIRIDGLTVGGTSA
jgi:TldD protein